MFLKPNRYFEGEEETVEGEEVETKETKKTSTTIVEKKFTQEDVNKFLAEEKRKAQKANEKIVVQLQELQKNKSLTEEEKQNLENRIETIRNDALTKEELARKESAKEKNKTKLLLENQEKETARWKKLYEETTTETSLLKAASSDPDVYNQEQMLEILLPKSRLVEELDSETNTPTGKYVTKVRLAGKDKDGKDITLELTPVEAVKQMKEMDKYSNLYINKATGGIGGNNSANNNRKNTNSPPTDNPAEYREWRKKNQNVLNNM